MKNYLPGFSKGFLLLICILFLNFSNNSAQTSADSLYLPPIGITSLNGYGPYVIGAERSNLFILYELPTNTSAVTMKMIDSKGEQINRAYSVSGTNLQTVEWSFESDTMDFPLSPQLHIEVYYQNDSLGIYEFPYTVYPDSLHLDASEGFGPFITNNYQFSGNLWQPVPALTNTFTATNLPPRTDSLEFEILTVDSIIAETHFVYATSGSYLDSAVYANVRMDNLPIGTKYLRTLIWCEGGPDEGLDFHRELIVNPQKPILTFISDTIVLQDSIGVFVENQLSGQSLTLDSVKHAEIQNGPGKRKFDWYPGPYSLDIMESSFSIEAWVEFDLDAFNQDYKVMDIMSVDSVWSLFLGGYTSGGYILGFSSDAFITWRELWTVTFNPSLLQGESWHHIAFTCEFIDQQHYPIGKYYMDGKPLPGVVFDQFNYDNIMAHVNYEYFWNTQALILGNPVSCPGALFSAIDEVRIWTKTLTEKEILENLRDAPLQQPDLAGYWNFDDLRNHLNYISDKSYNNNMGILQGGASFMPQHPAVQLSIDTLKIASSYIETDSVKYVFLDRNNQIVDSATKTTTEGITILAYDVASLPCNITSLKVIEYFHPSDGIGLETDYTISSLAPQPIATPLYNWNTYYATPDTIGKTFAPVTVSGFPDHTRKVVLGLKKNDQIFDTVSYTSGSIPFHHSLSLNGSNNYIQTSQQIGSPDAFTIMFWIKTSSNSGGKIIGFSDTQNGSSRGKHDREIIMKADGSINFNMLSNDNLTTLYALNINNDGEWHHIAAGIDENKLASLYVDGSMSQCVSLSNIDAYQGWWIVGKNSGSKIPDDALVSEYFEGSLSEISIWSRALDYTEINTMRFDAANHPDQVLHYNLDEGNGTTINDTIGTNDGTIKGSTPIWTHSNVLSYVTWNKNIINKQPGIYTFFAKVYYPFGPDEGAEYSLGNFNIADPFPGQDQYFYLSEGRGYFNQGLALNNTLTWFTDYDGNGSFNWHENFFRYRFFTADHETISHQTVNYTSSSASGQFVIDMGDAPPGSYLSIETGYTTNNNVDVNENSDAIPIYIHPMIPPKVKVSQGPFRQAIAPGSMQHNNTFTIKMEPLSDLDSIAVVFFDNTNRKVGSTAAVKLSDTLWTATYDMAKLSPPFSNMKLEYYLGVNPHPAATEGPIPITIQRTRPRWFDFIADKNFTNVNQSGNTVSFEVTTPFQKNWMVNNFVGVEIPYAVPMLGGMSSKMESPTIKAKLKYHIIGDWLEMNQTPEFYQEFIPLGFGSAELIRFNFNNSQNNSYELDENNNLVATQNFAEGGGIASDYLAFDDVVKRIGEILEASSVVDPASFVVHPTFKLSVIVGFEYASRLHMIIDTISGEWGSFGNLVIDANPEHTEAYKNSASYHFYSGSFGIEFTIGLEFFEGLASGNFGIDGRVALGYGHSYITIPNSDTRPLKSADFQVYGRFYIDVFWGWYEKNMWGPKMFYSANFWGDDLSECFPPIDKAGLNTLSLAANSSWPELATEIVPVGGFTKMSMPAPYPSVASSEQNTVFTWMEHGKSYGERSLKLACLNMDTDKFSGNKTIEVNHHAINSPVSETIDQNLVLLSWAQTRYDNKSILSVKPDDVLKTFLQAQDIWYAIYNLETNEVVQLEMIDDNNKSMTSGRAEAKPLIIAISTTRALIIWQVADLENHSSEIWNVVIEKQGGQWQSLEPEILANIEGIKTQLAVATPETGKAILTWLNSSYSLSHDKRIMSAVFDGSQWSTPEEIIEQQPNQSCNFFDMNFNNGNGAIVFTTFVNDSNFKHFEKLSLLPWDLETKQWAGKSATDLLIDSCAHLQKPKIIIDKSGQTAIAFKVEEIRKKSVGEKISQIDLLIGNLDNPTGGWQHIAGSEYVCDTTKQVADFALTYVNADTLMILTNEFPMLATNAPFEPVNGRMFGNPYMNMVLRCFALDENGIVSDIDEDNYFVGIGEPPTPLHQKGLLKNYPNPCHESTTLVFSIAGHSNAKLELFDLSGYLIATLFDQQFQPGEYEMNLNTTLLKPGIYTCRLRCGDRVDNLKINVY